MKVRGYEVKGINNAQTLFHYTARYRYTTEITSYEVRAYMVINKIFRIHAGTVYKTREEAEEALLDMQDWYRRALRTRDADCLIVDEITEIETVTKRRAKKLD